jgi:cold shock CspA family protein/ribosome-associated translation inhibitor RaiA
MEAAMAVDVQLSFRRMDPSPSVETQVRRLAAELEQFSDRISACRVMVEAGHQSQRQGKIYHIRIDLAVPGGKIVVSREPGLDHAHEDMHVAIRDAFDAARRRLQDHMRKMEGQTKPHAPHTIGHIVRLFPDRGYGFLATDTGEEIYVHSNSVHGDGFAHLKIGDRVRYVLDEETGEKGPLASAVFPLAAKD